MFSHDCSDEYKIEQTLSSIAAPAAWNLAGKKLKNVFQIEGTTILVSEKTPDPFRLAGFTLWQEIPFTQLEIINNDKIEKSIRLSSPCRQIFKWPDESKGLFADDFFLLCDCEKSYALVDVTAGGVLAEIPKSAFAPMLNQLTKREHKDPWLDIVGFVKSPKKENLFMVLCDSVPLFFQFSHEEVKFKYYGAWDGHRTDTWTISDDMKTVCLRFFYKIYFYTFDRKHNQKLLENTLSHDDRGVIFSTMRSLPGGGYFCYDRRTGLDAIDGTFKIVSPDFKVVASIKQLAPIEHMITVDRSHFLCTFNSKTKDNLICSYEHTGGDKIEMTLYKFPQQIAKIIARPKQAQLICLFYGKDDRLEAQVVNDFKPLLKFKVAKIADAKEEHLQPRLR